MNTDFRSFHVDFRKEPEDRWDQLLTDSWACRKARVLCRAIDKQMHEGFGLALLPPLVAKATRCLAGRTLGELDYLEDMEMWSEYAVGSLDEVILGNFAYELHQTRGGIERMKRPLIDGKNAVVDMYESLKRSVGLCTSVAFYHSDFGMVHCRNLDWPLPQIKDATVILNCKSNAGPFKAVTVPGMVGVLSGVAKGRFSITINSKEDSDHLMPFAQGWSAPLLVRWILENCENYEAARRELKKASAFVPFFVTLAGRKRGQAVVFEINTTARNRFYESSEGPVAVANHFPTESWEEDHCCSGERQDFVEASARQCKAKTLRGCFSAVNNVLYADTVQSMVLHPKSGEALLQRV
jgi:predicted choloylglycine hydrolase